MLRHLMMIALAIVASAAPAAVDPVRTVNDVRANGCGRRAGGQSPLTTDRRLDAVAERLVRGDRLSDAIAAERYPAARSTSIHVLSATDGAALERLLETRFCDAVVDEGYAMIGVARRDAGLWIVLAAPFAPPVASDAGAVSRRVLELVNEARGRARRCGMRRHAAARPVELDTTLGEVAAAHARDMARHSRMSHEGSDGSTAAERVTRAGYPWQYVAENVAAGQSSPEDVVKTWLASPGHCANLMNPQMSEMGVANAFNAASADGTYWAQVFATRR